MQAELTAYHRGEIDFTRFSRLTAKTWSALAAHLLRKWQAPPGVSVEDLQQELLFACWKMVPRYDPSRKVSLQKFVVYNTCDKAKKWLHKQRNAYRRDDKAPSRFPASLASLGLEEHVEERLMAGVAVPPSQEERLVDAEFEAEVRARIASLPTNDLAFMYYQRYGSVEAAALALLTSPRASIALRVQSIEAARLAVDRSLERAAHQSELNVLLDATTRWTNARLVDTAA